MNPTKGTLAIFDFDGTITTKDTLFDFIEFYHGKVKLIVGLFVISPVLISYKLGVISNENAKERMLSYFFKGESEAHFRGRCVDYAFRINQLLINEAIEKLKWHQAESHKILIDSASVEDWIRPWAVSVGIDTVIGTCLEVKDGIITGKLASRNCYGQEKVTRLSEIYPDKDKYEIYVYGDSEGDRELLAIATHPYYRCFN